MAGNPWPLWAALAIGGVSAYLNGGDMVDAVKTGGLATLAVLGFFAFLQLVWFTPRRLDREDRATMPAVGRLDSTAGLKHAIATFLVTRPTDGQWDHQIILYQNTAKELIEAAFALADQGLIERGTLERALGSVAVSDGAHVSERYVEPLLAIRRLLDDRPREVEIVPGVSVRSGPND